MFLFMADDTQTPRDANASGSGKTVLIADLVEQIRQRGERRVLYGWIPARRSGRPIVASCSTEYGFCAGV